MSGSYVSLVPAVATEGVVVATSQDPGVVPSHQSAARRMPLSVSAVQRLRLLPVKAALWLFIVVLLIVHELVR